MKRCESCGCLNVRDAQICAGCYKPLEEPAPAALRAVIRAVVLGLLLLLAPAQEASAQTAGCLSHLSMAATPLEVDWLVLIAASGCSVWQDQPALTVFKRNGHEWGPYTPYAFEWLKRQRPRAGAMWRTRIPALDDGDLLVLTHEGRVLAGICRPGGDTTPCYAATWRERE